MKKLIIILILWLLPICSYAAPGVGLLLAGSTGDTCFWMSGAAAGWNGEWDDGGADTDKLCVTGAAAKNGTLNSAATIEAAPSQPPSGGTVSLKFIGNVDYLTWPVVAGDILNSSEGSISMWIYAAGTTGFNSLWEIYVDADNSILSYVNTNNTIYFAHEGQTTIVGLTSTSTITDATWTKVQWEWSVTGGIVRLKISDGTPTWESSGGVVTVFTVEPTDIKLGEDNNKGVTDNIYEDDFKIWTTYNASD